jgi:uncharacterized protein (TIGR02217 family)
MSNALFPSLPGLTWDTPISPQFNTKVHRSVSGNEVRAAFMVNPLWKFMLNYEFLRDDITNNELKTLVGFFNARKGQFDSFLYLNPSDNSVSNQQFGVGDGVRAAFQLVRSYGDYTEPVQNVSGGVAVKINGVTNTGFTVSPTGLVTFSAVPANGAILTWSGGYYYRCRFLADSADFNQFMKNLYNLSKLEFIGSTMNKV